MNWVTFRSIKVAPDGSQSSDAASVRYRVLTPIREMPGKLARHWIIPILKPPSPELRERVFEADLLIFSKSFLPSNEELARTAKARGVRVVFDICDNHFDDPEFGPHYRAMAALADQVVCNTPEMAIAAGPYCAKPPVVIADPYEGPRGGPAFQPGEAVKLLWFGHESNLGTLNSSMNDLGAFILRRPLELVVLTRTTDALVRFCDNVTEKSAGRLKMTARPWSLDEQWRELAACDAVIIPTQQTAAKRVKSANRMIESLWAGRPVVAQPMPAYAPFARWTPVRPTISEGLATLLANAEKVEPAIRNAQAFIVANYDPAIVARQWADVIRQQKADGPVAQ